MQVGYNVKVGEQNHYKVKNELVQHQLLYMYVAKHAKSSMAFLYKKQTNKQKQNPK